MPWNHHPTYFFPFLSKFNQLCLFNTTHLLRLLSTLTTTCHQWPRCFYGWQKFRWTHGWQGVAESLQTHLAIMQFNHMKKESTFDPPPINLNYFLNPHTWTCEPPQHIEYAETCTRRSEFWASAKETQISKCTLSEPRKCTLPEEHIFYEKIIF